MGIVAVTFPIWGAVLLMIFISTLAGFIIEITPDEEYERQFAEIPEVKIFIEKYPDYVTSHSGEFLGWKVIFYDSPTADAPALYVKKGAIHGNASIQAGCPTGDNFSFTTDEKIINDILKNGC